MCLSGEGLLEGKEVLLSVIAGSISYGLFGEGWEIEVKVSDGFSDKTYRLVSFINEEDETFDFKEI